MGRARRGASIAFVVVVAFAAPGCCATMCPPPLPDHVGVPDVESRSPDFTLPIDADARERLTEWLKDEKGKPGDYQALLEVLADPAFPTRPIDQRMAELVRASGEDWRLAVNDARAKNVKNWVKSFAVGGGGFVWVVYEGVPDINGGRPTLVVVPRTFVVTARAE